jgi:hypothetical protein
MGTGGTAVLGNLAKTSTPIFAHARNSPFNLNVNFRACAKIVVEIIFCKTAVIALNGPGVVSIFWEISLYLASIIYLPTWKSFEASSVSISF